MKRYVILDDHGVVIQTIDLVEGVAPPEGAVPFEADMSARAAMGMQFVENGWHARPVCPPLVRQNETDCVIPDCPEGTVARLIDLDADSVIDAVAAPRDGFAIHAVLAPEAAGIIPAVAALAGALAAPVTPPSEPDLKLNIPGPGRYMVEVVPPRPGRSQEYMIEVTE